MRKKVLLSVFLFVGILLLLSVFDQDKISEPSTADADYVLEAMRVCLKDGSSQCYKNASHDFFQKFTLAAILEIFEQNEDKEEIFARCHEVTHYLGREEFQSVKSVPISFQNASAVCHGGSYHGVIEGYFDYKNIALDDPGALENAIRSVCGLRDDYQKENIYSECVHGIGHAMMFITEGELSRSLAFCDTLISRQDETTCYGGVFMENSSSSTNLDHPSRYLKDNNPMYPCDVLDEKYLEECYSYQSSHFALISRHDWAKVIELCLAVPESYRGGCFKVMGTNQVGFTQDMATRKHNCNLISEALYRDICFGGVVEGLVGRYHRDFPQIISFCSILAEENKLGCYTQVGRSFVGWVENQEDLRKKCQTITEKKFIPACLRSVT